MNEGTVCDNGAKLGRIIVIIRLFLIDMKCICPVIHKHKYTDICMYYGIPNINININMCIYIYFFT